MTALPLYKLYIISPPSSYMSVLFRVIFGGLFFPIQIASYQQPQRAGRVERPKGKCLTYRSERKVEEGRKSQGLRFCLRGGFEKTRSEGVIMIGAIASVVVARREREREIRSMMVIMGQ